MAQDKRFDLQQDTPDMSDARLDRLRSRLSNVYFAQELLEIEASAAAPTLFDQQIDAVGRCMTDNGQGQMVVVLNPQFDDAKLASFYAHELTHLRQLCVADMADVTHPLSFCENLLMRTFVIEADAYMRQSLFACAAFEAGDCDILADLTNKSVKDLVRDGTAAREMAMVTGDQSEDVLHRLFWLNLQNLCQSPALSRGYFDDTMAVVRHAAQTITKMEGEHLKQIDAMPVDALADSFDRLKDIGTITLKADAAEVNFLAREDSTTFFDRFFKMLPSSIQKEFRSEKAQFVKTFYEAKDAADAPKGQIIVPKIWLPGMP